MFDIGWSEFLVIGIVALIAIGPKELPGVLRMVGQWIGKVRRMASDFQGQFQEAMREAEMDDLKKQVAQIDQTTRDLTNFDPFETPRTEPKPSFGASTSGMTDASAPAPEPLQLGEPVLPVIESTPPAPEAAPALPETELVQLGSEPAPKAAAGGQSS
jgi:sec-independent protein translocase protein TatB